VSVHIFLRLFDNVCSPPKVKLLLQWKGHNHQQISGHEHLLLSHGHQS
jgi:hypothetical protein